MFYPQATESECTVALLLEVDPIRLVRGRRDMTAFTLGQVVNDRPYSATSLLAVALGAVFRTAMAGRCAAQPELAATPIPLTVLSVGELLDQTVTRRPTPKRSVTPTAATAGRPKGSTGCGWRHSSCWPPKAGRITTATTPGI